jgi:hypothetical protein
MIGIGRMSCAHWRSTQAHRLEGTIWIYGFWTGPEGCLPDSAHQAKKPKDGKRPSSRDLKRFDAFLLQVHTGVVPEQS